MTLRDATLERLDGGAFDVLIIGGGINGAVSAAALAARGASVALVDRNDFASFTSQASSNLVWGGFKYLENYELGLVFKLCRSRNRLIKAYPDNISQIGFLASLDKTAPFPSWLAGLGTVGYWGIGSFGTKRPQPRLTPEEIAELEPVVKTEGIEAGIEYYDAYLKDNDARFVFGFIRAALDVGAAAANYVELTSAERRDGRWQVELTDTDGGRTMSCSANMIVNAAGPFVDGLNQSWDLTTEHRIVYSKGIHLVVPQITPNERVLAFFDDTQRLFYVIPMGRRSVIGTTDTRTTDVHSPVTDEDRTFLLEQINARLNLPEPLTVDDVIAERCGVRPLVVKNDGDDQTDVDWTSLSRKHEIELDRGSSVVTVFGGKLTDCLNVGEEVAEAIEELGLPLEKDRHDWYGEPGKAARREFMRQARLTGLDDLRDRPETEPLSSRLWRRYGRRAFQMLEAIRLDPSMGHDIMDAADYLRVELHLAARTEMITKLEDFLRRRSKISQVVDEHEWRDSEGLREVAEILFGDDADRRLAEYFDTHPRPAHTAT